mgnify:CR=1 FL=1
MPELFSQKTSDFELVAWCVDVERSQARLSHTLVSRGIEIPCSIVYFTPAVTFIDSGLKSTTLDLKSPVFFENKSYEIEFIFTPGLRAQFGDTPPKIIHRLRSVEESFRYNPKTGSLRATINTGNDIGWFSLELVYQSNYGLKRQLVSFDILPIKMDMNGDVASINSAIDDEYPLWRFSLAEKTQQHVQANRNRRQQFLLLWLAQFESLWKELEGGIKHIINAPHSRLLSYSKSIRVDRLKGRLSPKLEMRVKEVVDSGSSSARFKVNKKRLSLDTPENRFIKFVMTSSIEKLTRINRLAGDSAGVPDKQRLSQGFFDGLQSRSQSLLRYRNHTLFQEVGRYNGMSRESLVLQQKPGYSKVYKSWQQLNWYLELLGNDSSISVRNIADLYEVWCFLQVKNIILALGFEEVANKRAVLVDRGLDVSMNDGMAGAFHFERSDGITIRLAHEPIFREGSRPIRTWMTTQKPDIVLTANFPNGDEFYWLFDAKYRIDTDDGNNRDLAPDDAINQMHRYRDALIHQGEVDSPDTGKTRPVFGAYVLYPGFFDQNKAANPYQQAIEQVSIGAFALLPSPDGTGAYWLYSFIADKLGADTSEYPSLHTDKYYVEEAARIPYKGTKISHYDDLTVIFSGTVHGRSTDYLQLQQDGKLPFYHTKLIATDRQSIERHIINEVRYLGLAVDNGGDQIIKTIYPVKSAKLVRRSELTEIQTGATLFDNPEESYWLFELGIGIGLPVPIAKQSTAHLEVFLTGYYSMNDTHEWSDLPQRYKALTE